MSAPDLSTVVAFWAGFGFALVLCIAAIVFYALEGDDDGEA